ncbi:PREDICTED: uncharacterized protein LOC104807035 [Tarenaya hassleriana]|uniref:uncharacterized protein LOC104807035 n=1 Tax=Tarenaya hassleriana TaxID=28532 RepID=UPI00053C9154|nr:PREDICTED: uncharacterized protein LOC104807035 [Tarenaya hassleriana]
MSLKNMWKLCFRRRQDASVARERRIRTLSSSSGPYLLLPMEVMGGGEAVNINLYDPRMEESVKIRNQTLPPELLPPSTFVGSSRGWTACMNDEDFRIHLTNMFNPSASENSHRVVSLPPFPCSSPTRMIKNVSLSSSPDQDDEDCVVAVKFRGNYIVFCRPGDSTWTGYESLHESLYATLVMYSRRDSSFYLPANIFHHTSALAWKMNRTELPPDTHVLKLGPVQLPDSMPERERELLGLCCQTKHLVESPTGEIFVVVWYLQFTDSNRNPVSWLEQEKNPEKEYWGRTKRFIVYRQEDTTQCYTEDIGDLCIFLGKNESFCIPASSYPGLKPNSVYYMDGFVRVYHLATGSIHRLPLQDLHTPFWLAPLQ